MSKPIQYVVYVEGRNAPSVRHNSLSNACTEASRLARLPDNANRTVVVAQITAACTIKVVKTEEWS